MATQEELRKSREESKLALVAMNRAIRKAFLTGDAYDPEGKGKAYWEEQDRLASEAEKARPIKRAS